jgi:signal transduction histidine kinase/CheY-like chemotaxis protein
MREGRYESEGWRVRKDGSQFWANVVVDPIRDESGQIIGFAKITRDVTAKREAQHQLEEAREALFQSQKLDAIGQLTGGIAHDFNNLLMVVLSSLELIRKRIGDDPKLLTLVDNATRGAKRGASLTQRLLSFARRQDLKPEAVDLRELVYGMSDLLRRSIGPSISFKILLPEGLSPVLVDPNQLELALLNLAVNARDAMPLGGVVTISAAQEASAGGCVGLFFSDTGIGMDEATLARATEPFFTTKGVGKGTGLGLSMVEGLASQSGGRFVLKSRRNEGTTAELWLPLASQAQGGEVAAAPAADSPASHQRCVLAVDDDPLVLANTVAMLEDLGHLALQAGSASEALALLNRNTRVQLVVTDQAMPDMTGTELIALLRHERPGLACILASGYAELGAASLPGIVRLPKPFDQQALSASITSAIDAERAGWQR